MQKGSIMYPADPQEVEHAAGLTLADALTLPPELGDLVRWMSRQRELSLAEVVAFSGQDESMARTMLEVLIDQGFVQEVPGGRDLRYRLHLARRRERKVPDWQFITGGNPLSVVRNPSGDINVVAGSSFELYVTVNNEGNQSALIDVYIDESSQPLYEWCAAPHARLALGPKQSGEVVFPIQIPVQVLPGVYEYLLEVDAQEHYPEDTPIQFPHRLRVLPPVQEVVQVNDPTFTVQPLTTSDQPAVLQPGQMLDMAVVIQNRSDRVDQFRLTCPDLADTWYTVRYPEGLNLPGLVTTAHSLDLNPGQTGQILLLLHPPLDALAGDYFPTLRIHSANNLDLGLLDVLYLRILPSYVLTSELRTLVGRVKRGAGRYDLRLMNEGNTARAIAIQAGSREEDDLCDYTLDSTEVVVPPKTATTIGLLVKPACWWRRPFYGGGRLLSFAVELEDIDQLPVQNPPQGNLVWEPRPWWQALLLALTSLGAIAALLFAIWLVFLKPPAPPKITEFSTDNTLYEAANGDFIRLNWQIANPTQLTTVRVTTKLADGTVAGQPVIYNFVQGIPSQLADFCVIERVLICRSVQTDAREAGNYVFELGITSKRGAGDIIDIQTTDAIPIRSEQPRITYFRINGQEAPSTKFLVPIVPTAPPQNLTLSWQVEGGDDLRVELLPSPGVVRNSGQIVYPLTQRPSSETLILRVTTASGEQISRSVVVETFDRALATPPPTPGGVPTLPPLSPLPPPPSVLPTIPVPNTAGSPPPAIAPSPPGAPATPGSAGSPTAPGDGTPATSDPNAPAPSDPDQLSPSELPPQFD